MKIVLLLSLMFLASSSAFAAEANEATQTNESATAVADEATLVTPPAEKAKTLDGWSVQNEALGKHVRLQGWKW